MSLPARAGLAGWPRAAGGRVSRSESLWWLVGVAAAFTAAQLIFVAPRLGLSWDETVYVSQVSVHAPAAYFDPARARGIPVLVAPVTMLTSSVLAPADLPVGCVRGRPLPRTAGLARLRPARQLALAGVFFAGLWTAEYYGPQAMPDLWEALSSLAATGLFLQAAAPAGASGARPVDAAGGSAAGTGAAAVSVPAAAPLRRRLAPLAGLAACVAVAALVRPGDALYLAAALGIAVIAVPRWRQWQLLAAIVAGFAAGAAQWVIEAYLRFGGPLNRLHRPARSRAASASTSRSGMSCAR